MKVIKIILIIIFLMSLGSELVYPRPVQDDCKKIELKIETVKTSDGENNGKVKVTLIKGDKKSAKFIFCESSGKVLNEKQFENENMDGLKKGNYICIVSTADCSKKISFTID